MFFRKAQLSDFQVIKNICSLGWRETYKHIHSEVYISSVIDEFYSLERLAKEIENSNKHLSWYVAGNNFVEGALLGAITSENSSEIYALYILLDYKNQGLGSHLMLNYEKLMREENIDEILLSVDEKNKNAIRFYQKNGFKIFRNEDTFYKKNEADSRIYRMVKKLN